jgi:eukaryotic-like serine/threonine-protein kinase
MNSPQLPPLLIRFATFELDLRARELRKDGRGIGLPDQSIKVLAMLLERPGELALREEIRGKLWPNDTVVEFDHSINTAIGRLRLALGDSAEKPQYIETLPRRGYRWIGPLVSRETREPIDPTPALAVEPSPQRISASALIGKKVSHYRVLEVLGGGGMGVVYKAEDLKLGRRVALKFLPEELTSSSGARHRFESEARSASALNHPNICTIYGVEEYEGQPFLAMEFLQGQTLRELIVTVPPGVPQLGLTKLLDLALQITAGLEAAHKQGIIHRDIKPANIFVTSEGQAKILDFGLAKSSLAGPAAANSPSSEQREDRSADESKHEVESLTAASPFLSRTGVAIGTAGYMSPEQARGEKLDARTDLFSFGLVLYELATGKRAFSGDTGPELRDAILTRMPSPARKVNPEVPAKLAKIVHRALEKNREARYQSAAELRTDLERLKREIEPSHRTRWLALTAAGVFVLLFAAAVFLYANRPPRSTAALPEIKLRQLTTNSSENAVKSGAISPDGKYLAYVDRVGMHLKLIGTGETRTVPQPEEIKSNSAEWEIGPGISWFPDGTRFLALLHPLGIGIDELSSRNSSIWIVSVLGGPPHKIRGEAFLDSISPDGSLIAFQTNKSSRFDDDREIWLMGPNGENARKLYETDASSAIGGLQWSPDGQRVIYVRTEEAKQTLVRGDPNGGPVTPILSPVDERSVSEFLWIPDGRLIYNTWEHGFTSTTCNLWQIRLDPRGEFIGRPQRITNLPAVCNAGFSVTADSKRLVFLESREHASVYVGDLKARGTHITSPSRLTLDEGWNNPAAWTADGEAVFFYSNRSGAEGLFKQSLRQDIAQPLFTVSEDESLPPGACLSREGSWGFEHRVRGGSCACLSPEGSWLFYLRVTGGSSSPAKLMRVPVTGGVPQLILTGSFVGGPRCARSPATLCAIAERSADRKQLAFTAFDPAKGRGRTLAEFTTESTADYEWDLSPDGNRLAILKDREGQIQILWLNDRPQQQITVKGWDVLTTLAWTADGKGLFTSSYMERGSVLLSVDLQGNARLLWETKGGVGTYAVPSPDGRHVAMQGFTKDANLWMMENF